MPFIGDIGTGEWVVIGIVVILLFGGKKLNELARGLGESGKELKRVKHEFSGAIQDSKSDLVESEKPKRRKKS